MKILFLHGWQSTPGGVKPTYLKDHGHEVLNPALPDNDFDAAVRIAQAEFDQHRPDVVVGSSRGGAVAMNINSGSTPPVLLCPAWKKWGTARTVKPGTIILHSGADDVVPFADSVELMRNSKLPPESLVEVGSDHWLADPDSLKAMLEVVQKLTPWLPQAEVHEYGVPRRFGVGTLLLITTMYAVLFAILRGLRATSSAFVVLGMFFFAIGLGQMLLFKGQHPRRASVIVGASLALIAFAITQATFPPVDVMALAVLFPAGIFVLFFGGVGGYVAGVFIAGVFLLADKIQRVSGEFKGPTTVKGQYHERNAG